MGRPVARVSLRAGGSASNACAVKSSTRGFSAAVHTSDSFLRTVGLCDGAPPSLRTSYSNAAELTGFRVLSCVVVPADVLGYGAQ